MDSSNLNDSKIYDRFRNKWVVKTPEEEVRQALLLTMTHDLGYPQSLISVEKGLNHFTRVHTSRRFDILCFSQDGEPLLLIECKAALHGEDAKNQLIGYNQGIKAPYLCLADRSQVLMGVQVGKKWQFHRGLAPYQLLVNSLCPLNTSQK